MSFDWYQYHRAAIELQLGSPKDPSLKEAYQRSSISRFYYSAYHVSIDYAKNKLGFNPSNNGSDHKDLRYFLKSKGHDDLFNYLSDLKTYRTNCDYRNVVNKIDNVCRQSATASSNLHRRISLLNR